MSLLTREQVTPWRPRCQGSNRRFIGFTPRTDAVRAPIAPILEQTRSVRASVLVGARVSDRSPPGPRRGHSRLGREATRARPAPSAGDAQAICSPDGRDVRGPLRDLSKRGKQGFLSFELPAIVQHIAERSAEREVREYEERRDRRKRELVEAAAALEAQFLSGADCKWTPVADYEGLFCRMKGRTFRLTKDAQKKWMLHRLASLDDAGVLVGRYASRGETSKVLQAVAYG